MRKVFLVTGFNNWGKTTLLSHLFDTRTFRKRTPEQYANCSFLVMPQSNDDLGEHGYLWEFNDRLVKFEQANGPARLIASAFCPTTEPNNLSINILRNLFQGDTVHMILLEHKWCGHAKLQLAAIQRFYANESNLTIHIVTATTPESKLAQVSEIFSANLQ